MLIFNKFNYLIKVSNKVVEVELVSCSFRHPEGHRSKRPHCNSMREQINQSIYSSNAHGVDMVCMYVHAYVCACAGNDQKDVK